MKPEFSRQIFETHSNSNREALRSHSDTLHSVGLLWMSDQSGSEIST